MASQAQLSHVAINKILLATDFSHESQNAVRYAVSLAKRYGATLFLTHVLPTKGAMRGVESWPSMTDVMQHNAERSMAKSESTEGLKFVPHEAVLRAGGTWAVISQVLLDKNMDLVVMGTRGHGGIKKLFLGSTAEKVMRHASCPVLTVGPQVKPLSLGRFGHILYATDFSDGSMRALNYALSLAEQDGGELTMLHVIKSNPASEPELIEWKLDDRQKLNQLIPPDVDLACKPEIEVEVGIPGVEIVRMADSREADLIVMGCHSGGAVSTHLPRTTLHHLLQHAHCPVLTLRGESSAANRTDGGQVTGVWFGE